MGLTCHLHLLFLLCKGFTQLGCFYRKIPSGLHDRVLSPGASLCVVLSVTGQHCKLLLCVLTHFASLQLTRGSGTLGQNINKRICMALLGFRCVVRSVELSDKVCLVSSSGISSSSSIIRRVNWRDRLQHRYSTVTATLTTAVP